MAILADLSEDNPWWKSKEKIIQDPKINEWENSIIKWLPRISYTFDFDTDLVYSLRGPRQIGKTTLVKLQIKKLLDSGVSPWNIMYYAFDIDNTPKNLVDIIKNYFDNTSRQRKNNRSYLFLDEISSIKDWQKGIKRLWDQRRLENCTILATGSHSVDLKFSAEKLPGRRGISNDALDKIMLPMKFSEYVSVLDEDISKELSIRGFLKISSRLKLLNNLSNHKIDPVLEEMQSYLPDLNRLLSDYMITGGIPRVVNEYADTGMINEGTYNDYLNAILGDLQSLNKNENIFRQVIQNVIKSIGWPSSWRSLQKDTDIGGQNTVPEYINTLQNMFVLTILYQYDSEKRRGLLQKEKKINFHDPFNLHVLNGWINGMSSFELSQKFLEETSNQGAVVEGIVADHLIRMAFNLSPKKQNFVYENVLYHWRYGKEKEVDFIYNDTQNSPIPIEVKFQQNITKRDLDGITNFKKYSDTTSGLLLSKNKLGTTLEATVIPVSLFLLLI